MKQDTLCDLICALEYGTKLHITVVFLDHYGNEKTKLPREHKIHDAPVCDAAKAAPEGLAACLRCRNTVIRLLQHRKRPLNGLCVHGVYEYCRPVVRGNAVAAVIFIGNICPDDPQQLSGHIPASLHRTMQKNCPQSHCERTADVLERYIHFLLDTYGETEKKAFDPLLENIKSYIEENLLYGLSVRDLAQVFRYDEKYLGRLFKAKTGCCVREYCNRLRIDRAKALLRDSSLSIAAVAAQAGYNNLTYFNRVFKQITGVAPHEFRKISP